MNLINILFAIFLIFILFVSFLAFKNHKKQKKFHKVMKPGDKVYISTNSLHNFESKIHRVDGDMIEVIVRVNKSFVFPNE